jgi:hypothetical protein
MGLATAVVLSIAVAAGLVRLLPWIVAPGVPPVLVIPFAEHLGRAAIDVAVVVGMPIGAAVAAALFVESGQSRALLALGASPLRLVGSSVVLVAAGFAVAVAVVGSTRWGMDRPGRFAARLIDAGRAACTAGAARRVDLPLVGAGWLCFRPVPRMVGRVPGLRSEFLFSASSVSASDDLSEVELGDFRLSGKVGGALPTVDVHVDRGRIRGLPAAGAARSRTFGALRGAFVCGAASVAALGLAWAVLRHSISRPFIAACIAGLAAISLLFVLRAVERRVSPPALPVALRSDR